MSKQTMRTSILCLLAMIAAGGASAFAQGQIITKRPHLPPINHPRASHALLQVRSLNLHIQVQDRQAITQVEHVFYNPGGRMEEGTFIFPLPKGATIDAFDMWIGGRKTPAELLNANKARKIYTDIVRSMRDPALLEFADNGLLTMKVFPIEARSEKKIRLVYRQVIQEDQNLQEYVFPLRAARFAQQRIGTIGVDVDVTMDGKLQTLYSPSHEFTIQRQDDAKARMYLSLKNHLPKRDIKLLWSDGKQEFGMDMLTHYDGVDTYYWMTLSPNMTRRRTVPRDIVLLVDTSGSMAGEKMKRAKAALRFCVANFNPSDHFELIAFGTEARALSGRLLPNKDAFRQKAETFIQNLRPLGGTNMEEAIRMAKALPTSNRQRMTVLITDGKPTIGLRDEAALLRLTANESGRFFSFGIGYEVNTHLLDKFAEKGRGWSGYATPDEDLELKLSSFYAKISAPVLSELQLTSKDVRLYAQQPISLPDLFFNTPLYVFGKLEGHGRASIQLSGRDENQRLVRFNFPTSINKNTDHRFIPRLWAKRRIGFLLDEIRLHGADRELVDEVKRLAQKHGILTPYTSYLILEDEAVIRADQVATPSVRESERIAPLAGYTNEQRKVAKEKSGGRSVQQSRFNKKLKDSVSLDQKAYKLSSFQEQNQVVAGRAFYKQENGLWLDQNLEGRQGTQVNISFAGEAYFQLLKTYPQLAPILALGPKVRFYFQGKTYTISEHP